MEIEDPGGRLNDAELGDLARLLARFASHDLDHWENWRIQTSYGPVYVSITRKLMPEWPEETFETIWPPPRAWHPRPARCGGREGYIGAGVALISCTAIKPPSLNKRHRKAILHPGQRWAPLRCAGGLVCGAVSFVDCPMWRADVDWPGWYQSVRATGLPSGAVSSAAGGQMAAQLFDQGPGSHLNRPGAGIRAQEGNSPRVGEVLLAVTTFGIIGAGHIGSAVAQAVIRLGHNVVIANSRGPETLSNLIGNLGPSARAATVAEAAVAGDVAVVTIPFGKYREVPVEPLAGKIVLDTNNYYWERDGRFPELDRGEATTSGLLQAHLTGSKVVKAFNHITAAAINTDGSPAGTPDRRALAVSSDYPEAVAFVVDLYDKIGFDAVNVGPLAESWRVERDRPAYVVRQNKAELEANLAKAPRTI